MWLVDHSRAVCIVRMVGKNGLHHIICVDSRDGRKIIIDSEEVFPIRLSYDALRLCGHPEEDPKIVEIRQLVSKKKYMFFSEN